MVEDTALNVISARPLDPNVRQRIASDPATSVWVNASAGTGKTKVLTDRVLRLLLPRENGHRGTDPHRLLCLTYTKAAANEMKLRISETLSKWAVMEDDTLSVQLKSLIGNVPDADMIHAARRLFTQVGDMAGGLNIVTIHAFCQSVLARFPLEAGLLPGFELLEDEDKTRQYIERAITNVIRTANQDKGSDLYGAVLTLTRRFHQDQLTKMVQAVLNERHEFDEIMAKHFGAQGLYTALCQTLGVKAGQSPEDFIDEYIATLDETGLKMAADILGASKGKKDQGRSADILSYLALDANKRRAQFFDFVRIFLIKENRPHKSLAVKAISEAFPDTVDFLNDEAARLCDAIEHYHKIMSTHHTRDLFLFCDHVARAFDDLKIENGVLDFNDLILKTETLLKTHPSWVMYKLDRGLDHILVDEAQDTNPEQWRIVDALVSEFYAGKNAHDESRTIFVVGDEKQSIYGFQRASPEAFSFMKDKFADKITAAEQGWESVSLDISFRSTHSVLNAVDAIFTPQSMRAGVSHMPLDHRAHRRNDAGLVSVWPLFEHDADEDEDNAWAPAVSVKTAHTAQAKLCSHIAETIAGWIKNGEILESRNRPIAPGDILILLKKRGSMMMQLTNALNNAGLPVSGKDRLVLNEEIIVQDLYALLNFVLAPHDDLALAGFLKSPFIGMDDDDLFILCHPRGEGETLWDYWGALESNPYPAAYAYLSDLYDFARTATAYDFITHVLQSPCPAHSISGWRAVFSRMGEDCEDALVELLNAALHHDIQSRAGLRDFLQTQQNKTSDIKRETNEGDKIRIMTVHGAKGLQAPIVFMPDTIRQGKTQANNVSERLIWPSKSGFPLPLWVSVKDDEFEEYTALKDKLLARSENEYRRLLYVAMTRAEDRLYIGGALGKRKPDADSWYFMCHSGMDSMDQVQTLEDGTLVLSNPQIETPNTHEQTEKPVSDFATPAWLHQPIEGRAALPVSKAVSLEDDTSDAALRGTLIHRLFEILPGFARERQRELARTVMAQSAAAKFITEADLEGILDTLHDPDHHWIFNAQGRSEVPIAGRAADGSSFYGRIDRLVVSDDTVHIIDYKTGHINDHLETYTLQLTRYANIMKNIYPDHTIKAGLLWVDTARYMPIF